jgi:hypothetical protein
MESFDVSESLERSWCCDYRVRFRRDDHALVCLSCGAKRRLTERELSDLQRRIGRAQEHPK